jgi:NADH:ubiquinone oxidoreductase subunit 6 (subunit J)
MLVANLAGDIIVWIVWITAAFTLLGSGMAVVLFQNPFYSALALILNLGSLAVLYLLLQAEFVAAAQVLIYAGAIVVLFLFVIAYLGGRADAPWAGSGRVRFIATAVATIAISAEIVVAVAIEADEGLATSREISSSFGSPREIGELFLSNHLLAFEVTSIVLFIAAVGAAVLGAGARRRDSGATTTTEDTTS